MSVVYLPEQLVKPEPRRLKDLKCGETAYAGFVALVVKADRSCFLDLEIAVGEKALWSMRVTRDDDGGYHVVVRPDLQFVPGGSVLQERSRPLVPVASLTVSS